MVQILTNKLRYVFTVFQILLIYGSRLYCQTSLPKMFYRLKNSILGYIIIQNPINQKSYVALQNLTERYFKDRYAARLIASC